MRVCAGFQQVWGQGGEREVAVGGQAFPRRVKILPGSWFPLGAGPLLCSGPPWEGGLHPQMRQAEEKRCLCRQPGLGFPPFPPAKITRIGNYCHCTDMYCISAGTSASVPHPPFPYIRVFMCAHLYKGRFSIYLSFPCVIWRKNVIFWWRKRVFGVERDSRAGLWQEKGKKAEGGAQVNFVVSFFISKGSWFRKAFWGRICLLWF